MAATLTLLLLLTLFSFALVSISMTLRESGDKILHALAGVGLPVTRLSAARRPARSRRQPAIVRVRSAWSAAAA